MDGLPDGLTDELDDVQMERNLPRYWTFGKFHTVILLVLFTMNLADGWMTYSTTTITVLMGDVT